MCQLQNAAASLFIDKFLPFNFQKGDKGKNSHKVKTLI